MTGFGNDNKNIRKKNALENDIPNKNKLISNAFLYHSKGRIKEASEIYKYLIKKGFNDPRILTNLGTIYQQLNDFDKAAFLYKESIKRFPKSFEAYANLGSILGKKNKLEEAKSYLKKAIELNSSFLMPYSMLASININEGKLKEAEKLLRKCIAINPNIAESHLNLGCLLKELGKIEEAEISLRKSLEIKPNNDLALTNLAVIILEIGKAKEAEKLLDKAISINPNSSMAFNCLGNIYSNKKILDLAEESYRKAIKLQPNFALAHNNLGNLLLNNGNIFEAEDNYRKAINLEPNFDLALNNLGSLLLEKGKTIEAENFVQKAIDSNPKFELAYVNLGSIKFELNKLQEAENLYLKAIEIKDDYKFAYINLFDLYDKTNNLQKLRDSLTLFENNKNLKNDLFLFKARLLYRDKKFTKAKDYINKIPRKWLEDSSQKAILLYWSFKGFIEEKEKNFQEAYQCFERSQLNPDYKKCDPKIFENYIHTYRKNLENNNSFKRKNYQVKNGIELVFLLGFPRSGTTLLDTILRSHPEIDVVEEKPIIQNIENIISSQYKYSLSEISKLNDEQLRNLRELYLKKLMIYSTKSKEAKVLIDKFPFNTVCLPLINLLFPNAKIIFTHRNPYDTVLSCFQQAFEPNNAMANFRSIDSSARIYDLTMKMWVEYKDKLDIKYVTSKYEDLIKDFDNNILKVLNFLNLKWNKNIKNYRDTALKREKINTPSSSQVIQPLYKTSIEKWRYYEKFFKDSHIYLDQWRKYFEY
ncbi:TPR repeat [Prochlorococcus marinus str. MIT 9201]|uniref:TPR repeat n=1 Tax=Prochlorococcus marinus str. MIT 9201 TaxID=93057 RepID=A0A0A2A7T0_PROMR|nr:tetratricopeptide repeat-containing sulfotransferase family protein [Prochlorococcus marinus]KGF97967.1 TPR repeat [Prochlorococcus marinus str. MIT 9201]